ncbi:FAD-dependent oxidoreductase [Rhizobium laguerreae]|uniref:NAD(P)/FAD-dependent oxidoreductase n=1 Tax=Rhizobium laguerreae TaxID=1076926 RepID=UPI001C90EEBA|nr:FAD-binding oxidoreductase [Rhizobium laguerreae]MBY3095659.1 FAD-dependent oxidoreductase [Rhizobium laguerreae]
MTNDAAYDALIIGNGALGLALGFRLAQRGQRVSIVGPSGRRFSASQAAGAMNGTFGEVTRDLLASAHGRQKLEMDIAATDLWEGWCEEIRDAAGEPQASLRRKDGTTIILNGGGTDAVDTENFVAIREALSEYERSYQMLEGHEVPWVTAQGGNRPFQGVHIPDEHSINTPVYLPTLEKAFRSVGGLMIDGLVQKIGSPRSSETGWVELADGRKFYAHNIVLAAGALSHDLLASSLPEIAPYVPPVTSGYGASVLLSHGAVPAPPSVIRTPNRAFACGLHAVPRKEGIYVGATNKLQEKPQLFAHVPDLHALLERAMRQMHAGFGTSGVLAVNVGNRPVPVDGFPLIGALPDTRLWMLTGTYRDGFHQSPYLADKMAEAILDGVQDPLLEAFAPVRSPIQSGRRDDIIAAAVDHALAVGFEAEWRVSVRWPTRIAELLATKYRHAVEDLHDTITPPPDVLVCMSDNDWLRRKLRGYYDVYSRKRGFSDIRPQIDVA